MSGNQWWLDWAAVALPSILSAVGVYVSIESPRLESHSARWAWRIGLIAFGILVSVLTYLQQEAARDASNQQQALNYTPSVVLIYADKKFNVHNLGKTDLYLWGTKLGAGPQTIEQQYRIIVPGAFYYLPADEFESKALANLGGDGEIRVPFEIYLSNALKQKYTARFELLIIEKTIKFPYTLK